MTHLAVMSFHSPCLSSPHLKPTRRTNARSVTCDLPANLDLLPGEIDLIEMWFGDVATEIVRQVMPPREIEEK